MKRKKIKKKLTKKNIGFVLFYLKMMKILKIVFHISVIVFFVYCIFLFYKNDVLRKFREKSSLYYSTLLYKNICINIDIRGIDRVNIENLQNSIYKFCNLEDKSNLLSLLSDIQKDPWVKNITIKRKIPNALEIVIEEYLPFAIWKNNNNLYLLDESGKIIKISEREKKEYSNLLMVSGEGSRESIHSLFNLLSSNPSLFSRIKSAIRIGNRRWNLELDNGIIIKMPESNVVSAWHKLYKILEIQSLEIDLKTIDLRNIDRVFIEEI